MADVDTRTDVVEFLAIYYDDEGRFLEVAQAADDEVTAAYAERCRDTAATLRALAAERDAAVESAKWWKEEATAALTERRSAEKERDAAVAKAAAARRAGIEAALEIVVSVRERANDAAYTARVECDADGDRDNRMILDTADVLEAAIRALIEEPPR